MKSPWFVYLLRCADSTLYTGITTDIGRRLAEHNTGKAGARYTRARRPVVLVWQQQVPDRSMASRCEYLLRQLSKVEKEALVATGSALIDGRPEAAAAIQEPSSPAG